MEWCGAVDLRADDLVRPDARKRAPQRDVAIELIRTLLDKGAGRIEARTAMAAAKQKGISDASMSRSPVLEHIGVKAESLYRGLTMQGTGESRVSKRPAEPDYSGTARRALRLVGVQQRSLRYRGASMTHFEGGRLATRWRHTRNRRALAVAVATLIALGGACGGGDDDSPANAGGGSTTLSPTSQHFDSDFTQVCRGTGVEWATPYDPATIGAHKVVVFQGSDEAHLTSVATGNADWDILFDAATDAYASVELVACAVRTSDELAQTCTGYKDDDGTDSGKTVEYHSATYATTLRAATTAEVLDETTIEAPAGQCPMLVYFDEGETTTTEYANVDANTFLLPHATT